MLELTCWRAVTGARLLGSLLADLYGEGGLLALEVVFPEDRSTGRCLGVVGSCASGEGGGVLSGMMPAMESLLKLTASDWS